MPIRQALIVVLISLGCRTAPVATQPGPLPQATDWNVDEKSGAFLGLHSEENSGGSLEARWR